MTNLKTQSNQTLTHSYHYFEHNAYVDDQSIGDNCDDGGVDCRRFDAARFDNDDDVGLCAGVEYEVHLIVMPMMLAMTWGVRSS